MSEEIELLRLSQKYEQVRQYLKSKGYFWAPLAFRSEIGGLLYGARAVERTVLNDQLCARLKNESPRFQILAHRIIARSRGVRREVDRY